MSDTATLGMQAVVLLRLRARAGQVVPVAELAAGRMRVEVARAALEALLAQGCVQCTRDAQGLIAQAWVAAA